MHHAKSRDVNNSDKKFQEHFKYLKLNIVQGEEIAFLDLSISFDYLTNRIRTNLYTKPTTYGSFSFLLKKYENLLISKNMHKRDKINLFDQSSR